MKDVRCTSVVFHCQKVIMMKILLLSLELESSSGPDFFGLWGEITEAVISLSRHSYHLRLNWNGFLGHSLWIAIQFSCKNKNNNMDLIKQYVFLRKLDSCIHWSQFSEYQQSKMMYTLGHQSKFTLTSTVKCRTPRIRKIVTKWLSVQNLQIKHRKYMTHCTLLTIIIFCINSCLSTIKCNSA